MSLLKRTKNQPPPSDACKYAISFWSGHRLTSICFVHAFEFSLQFPSITQPHWFLSIFPAGWLETVLLWMFFFSLCPFIAQMTALERVNIHTLELEAQIVLLMASPPFSWAKTEENWKKIQFAIPFPGWRVWVCCSVFPSARFSILFHFPVGLCHLESNRVPFYFL